MTDISDLREGDEIEAVIRLTVVRGRDQNRFWDRLVVADKDGAVLTGLVPLFEIADLITVVRPEIIPGRPYVDADGKLYIGRGRGRIVTFDDEGHMVWHANRDDYEPLPAGLRAAKVVPEP